MKNHSIFHATLETSNFTFEAFGLTAADAKTALETGLLKHAAQYSNRLSADWWRPFESDIAIREVAFGECYRDREKLTQI